MVKRTNRMRIRPQMNVRRLDSTFNSVEALSTNLSGNCAKEIRTANVLASEEAGKLTLPSIEMKNITVASAVDAVELLTSQLPNPAVSDTIFDDSTQQETRIITTQNPVEPLEVVVRVMNASDALESFRDDACGRQADAYDRRGP